MKGVKFNRLNDHFELFSSRCEGNLPVASRRFFKIMPVIYKMGATQDNILRSIIPILRCPSIVYYFSESHI